MDFSKAILFGAYVGKPEIITPSDGIVFMDAGHGRGYSFTLNGTSISIAEHAISVPVAKMTKVSTGVNGSIFVPFKK